MSVGLSGCLAALASRWLTLGPILSSLETARLPPSISFSTSFLNILFGSWVDKTKPVLH